MLSSCIDLVASPQLPEQGLRYYLVPIFRWQSTNHARAPWAKEEAPNMSIIIAGVRPEVRQAIQIRFVDLANCRVGWKILPHWTGYTATALHTRHD